MSFIVESNLGVVTRGRSVASLYAGTGGCNHHMSYFLQPYKDLDEFTSKDLKKLKQNEELSSEFLQRYHARMRAVMWQFHLNNKEIERLNSLPDYKINSAIETRINELAIANDSILKEFKGEDGFTRSMKELEVLFNDFYNGRITNKEIGEKLTENQIEALIRFFPLDPTTGQKVTKKVVSNFFTVAPLILVPIASVALDGGLTAGIMAGLKLSAGIKGLDWALDLFMDNMTRVVSAQKLILLTAATTNIPELGASQVSAVIGDPLAEVASTPLGSNPANFLLAGFALFTSLRAQAVTKGIIRSHERFGPNAIWKTLKGIDRKAMRKHLGIAGIFAIDALIFQYMVKPAMQQGNMLPLIGWLTVNIPMLFKYFRKGAVETQIEMGKNIIGFQEGGAKRVADLMKRSSFEFEETGKSLLAIADEAKKLQVSKKGRINPKKVEKLFKEFKENIEKSPTMRMEIERAMHFIDDKDLYVFLKMGNISDGEIKKLTKAEKIDIVKGIALGFAAIIGFSILLDMGVSDLTEAIPGMDKSAGGFFILSFFSSLGEFLTSKKLFSMGDYAGGAQNIAYSNAINLTLAKMALATSFFKNQFFNDVPAAPEENREEEESN